MCLLYLSDCDTKFSCCCCFFFIGPPTPTFVNASMVMNSTVAGLFVSWDVAQDVYGSIQYQVISDQNLTCSSTSGSCTLWAAGCGETHAIQVTAANEAGPSQPSSPVLFITRECQRNLGIYSFLLLSLLRMFHCSPKRVLVLNVWFLSRPLPSRLITAGGVT